jgi:protein phosphatase
MNPMGKLSLEDTGEWPALGATNKTDRTGLSTLVRVDLGGLSHQGLVRSNNEDHFLITRFGRFFECLQSNLPQLEILAHSRETGYAMAVADGIGGNASGEVASQLAIRSLVNLVLNTPDWILILEDDAMSQEVMRRASERLADVNEAMADQADSDPRLQGFGTTLTLAWSLGTDLFLTHVGDSRAYLLRNHKLHQLTRDHTAAQELADQGVIAVSEVASHHWRHVLTKALGGRRRQIEPDVQRITLADTDCLLLCTDGLTEMVAPDRISEIAQEASTAAQACEMLVDAALSAGGKDNVTVVVARYQVPV